MRFMGASPLGRMPLNLRFSFPASDASTGLYRSISSG